MSKSFVYFLVDADISACRFKIGYSVDPYDRQRQFEQSIDFSKSLQFECAEQDVQNAERVLHRMFRKFRIDRSEMPRGDGYTEWFDMECFDSARELMSAYRTHLECGEGMPIPIPLEMPKSAENPATRIRQVPQWTSKETDRIISAVAHSQELFDYLLGKAKSVDREITRDGIEMTGTFSECGFDEIRDHIIDAISVTAVTFKRPFISANIVDGFRWDSCESGIILTLRLNDPRQISSMARSFATSRATPYNQQMLAALDAQIDPAFSAYASRIIAQNLEAAHPS